MNESDERAAFERWADAEMYNLVLRPTGKYRTIITHNAWQGWRARASVSDISAEPHRACARRYCQQPAIPGGYRCTAHITPERLPADMSR